MNKEAIVGTIVFGIMGGFGFGLWQSSFGAGLFMIILFFVIIDIKR